MATGQVVGGKTAGSGPGPGRDGGVFGTGTGTSAHLHLGTQAAPFQLGMAGF